MTRSEPLNRLVVAAVVLGFVALSSPLVAGDWGAPSSSSNSFSRGGGWGGFGGGFNWQGIVNSAVNTGMRWANNRHSGWNNPGPWRNNYVPARPRQPRNYVIRRRQPVRHHSSQPVRVIRQQPVKIYQPSHQPDPVSIPSNSHHDAPKEPVVTADIILAKKLKELKDKQPQQSHESDPRPSHLPTDSVVLAKLIELNSKQHLESHEPDPREVLAKHLAHMPEETAVDRDIYRQRLLGNLARLKAKQESSHATADINRHLARVKSKQSNLANHLESNSPAETHQQQVARVNEHTKIFGNKREDNAQRLAMNLHRLQQTADAFSKAEQRTLERLKEIQQELRDRGIEDDATDVGERIASLEAKKGRDREAERRAAVEQAERIAKQLNEAAERANRQIDTGGHSGDDSNPGHSTGSHPGNLRTMQRLVEMGILMDHALGHNFFDKGSISTFLSPPRANERHRYYNDVRTFTPGSAPSLRGLHPRPVYPLDNYVEPHSTSVIDFMNAETQKSGPDPVSAMVDRMEAGAGNPSNPAVEHQSGEHGQELNILANILKNLQSRRQHGHQSVGGPVVFGAPGLGDDLSVLDLPTFLPPEVRESLPQEAQDAVDTLETGRNVRDAGSDVLRGIGSLFGNDSETESPDGNDQTASERAQPESDVRADSNGRGQQRTHLTNWANRLTNERTALDNHPYRQYLRQQQTNLNEIKRIANLTSEQVQREFGSEAAQAAAMNRLLPNPRGGPALGTRADYETKLELWRNQRLEYNRAAQQYRNSQQ